MLKTISIGIPAYNEEANIKALLSSVLAQTGEFELKEIIIFSDGSTDNTVKLVREFQDPRINLIENQERVGQAEGQNIITRKAEGDIIVLLNADVLPGNEHFIHDLVRPFVDGKDVGIVAPRIQPVAASGFFERVVNYSVEIKNHMFRTWKQGNNIYTCCGRARAFSKAFAKSIVWPTASSEDAYSYLFCAQQRCGYEYLDQTLVLYKSPSTFRDHMKQSTRFLSGPKVMSRFFPSEFVTEQYQIPLGIQLRSATKYFLKNPALFTCYVAVLVLSNIWTAFHKYDSSLWSISQSSKNLSK